MLRASVIVCTYNRERLLPDCLARVARQDLGAGEYELLVVDNGSRDGTAAAVARFREHAPIPCTYVLEPRQGLSNARNRGLREARAPIAVFLDDDALAEPDWLRQLLLPFDDPGVVAVGGGIRWKLPDLLPEWVNGETFERYTIPGDVPIRATEGSWPIGANMAFRAAALQGPQPFDPDLGRRGGLMLSSEETALCRELAAAGGTVMLQPRAVVEHVLPPERFSFAAHLDMVFGHGATKVILQLKEHPRRRWWLALKALSAAALWTMAYGLSLLVPAAPARRRHLVKLHRYRGMMAAAGLLSLEGRDAGSKAA